MMSTTSPPDRSCISASPRECAGSVDMMSVRSPASAQRTAIALDVVVLPTPPLPPTKMSRCEALSLETKRCSEPVKGATGATQRAGATRRSPGDVAHLQPTGPAVLATQAAGR
eukprot:scaffold14498_cov121-Isochrysis_galbana.AAC.1